MHSLHSRQLERSGLCSTRSYSYYCPECIFKLISISILINNTHTLCYQTFSTWSWIRWLPLLISTPPLVPGLCIYSRQSKTFLCPLLTHNLLMYPSASVLPSLMYSAWYWYKQHLLYILTTKLTQQLSELCTFLSSLEIAVNTYQEVDKN